MRSLWAICTYLSMIGGALPLASLMDKCLKPPFPHHLDDACSVKNLIVYDHNKKVVTDDSSCGYTVNKKLFDLEDEPAVDLASAPSLSPNQNLSFLMAVLDNTNKRLITMVANLTVLPSPLEKRLMPRPEGGSWRRLRSKYIFTRSLRADASYEEHDEIMIFILVFDRPIFDDAHHAHEIEYLVFAQATNFPPNFRPGDMDSQFATPFDFFGWLKKQVMAGNLICGPIAGAKVLLHDDKYSPPAPTSTLFPPFHPGEKDSAFRSCSSTNLVSVVVAAVIFAPTRH